MRTQLLIACSLCVVATLLAPGRADIGLTLRNGGGRSKGYLPPPPPPAQSNDPEPTVSTFQESNYGNSQYQIFEVHNNFNGDPSDSGSQRPTQSSFRGSEYLPPSEQKLRENIVDNLDLSLLGITTGPGEKIRIEHVHAPAPVGGPSPPSPLPVSAPVTAEAPSPAVPIPFPSNYQHDFHKKGAQQQQQQQQQQQYADNVNVGVVEEPRPISYLPAQQEQQQPEEREPHIIYQPQQQQQQQPQEYQQQQPQEYPTVYEEEHLPQQQQQQTYQDYQSPFKGPDYLPPTQANSLVPSTTTISSSYATTTQYSASNGVFKGPDYLPPTTQGSSVESREYAAPDYLPPTRATHQESYEPPQQYVQTTVASSAATSAPAEYRAPGYLPPGYDFANPEQQQPQQQQQYGLVQTTVASPLHQSTTITSIGSSSSTIGSVGQEYQAPGYLPPQYGQQQKQVSPQDVYQQAGPALPTQSAPQSLPQGYDFQKPENAADAIAQLHSQDRRVQQQKQYEQQQQQQQVQQQQVQHVQQHVQQQQVQHVQQQHVQQQQQQHVQQQQVQHVQQQQVQHVQQQHVQQHQNVIVQSQIQVEGREVAGDIVYGQPKPEFRANGYLPPAGREQQSAPQQPQQPPAQYQPTQQPYRAPEYLPPTSNPVPPAVPQVQQNLHHLSSYMTAVQPHERYAQAPRKPFAEYGPPPTSLPEPSQNVVFPDSGPATQLSPMYREQSKRPTYYAPGMSYLKSDAAYPKITYSSSLSAQAKESLQKFMPKDVQQQIMQQQQYQSQQSQVSTNGNGGKVRTVQIINANAVRTLKVLETLDRSGVKTIKILGTSQESPMGEHHVVKVVTQNGASAAEHVQTVKIFNDQKDITLPAPQSTVATHSQAVASTSASSTNNGYLPPFRSRIARESWLRKKQLKRQSSGDKLANGRPR